MLFKLILLERKVSIRMWEDADLFKIVLSCFAFYLQHFINQLYVIRRLTSLSVDSYSC